MKKMDEGERAGVIRACAPQSDIWHVFPHRRAPQVVALMTQELTQLGVEFYLPELARFGRRMVGGVRPGAPELIREPMFPGYIFTRLGDDRKAMVSRVYGVSGKPLGAIRPSAMEAMRHAEAVSLGLAEAAAQPDRPDIAPGIDVDAEILGKFMRAVVVERVGTRRVALLAVFMGRHTRFVVDLAHVVRAQDGAARVKRSA